MHVVLNYDFLSKYKHQLCPPLIANKKLKKLKLKTTAKYQTSGSSSLEKQQQESI